MQRLSKKKKPMFEYSFDEADHLVHIRHSDEYEDNITGSILYYADRFITGYDYQLYDGKAAIRAIHEFVYDSKGRIQSCLSGYDIMENNRYEEFDEWNFSYGRDGLQRAESNNFLGGLSKSMLADLAELGIDENSTAEFINAAIKDKDDFFRVTDSKSFFNSLSLPCVNSYIYLFNHDEEGRLSSYIALDRDGHSDGCLYEIAESKKRKI